MNDNENQKITREYLLGFLKQENLATLSTITSDNNPDAATIYYMIKDNFNIYFLTRNETGKYKNIQKHQEVVLTITNEQKLETVKIRGKAQPVTDNPTIITDIITTLAHSERFVADLDQLLPIIKRDAGEFVVLKVEPYKIRMSKYDLEFLQEELFYFDPLA